MTRQPDFQEMTKLADSICNLLDALVQLFPDSEQEEMDTELFLTLLEKTQKDALALKASIPE